MSRPSVPTTRTPPIARWLANVTGIGGLVLFGLTASVAGKQMLGGGAEEACESATATGRVDACDRACRAGSAKHCFLKGSLLAEGDSTHQEEAALAFKDACDKGDNRGCASYAERLRTGRGMTKDAAQAASVFEKACDGGEARACAGLGQMHELGDVPNASPARAAELYDKACKSNLGFGCYLREAQLEQDDTTSAADLLIAAARAIHPLETECRDRVAESCGALGRVYLMGKRVPRKEAEAKNALKSGCDAGDPESCVSLAALLPDTEAVTQLSKACDGGTLSGCARLGLRYRSGRGVPKDAGQAKGLLQKACNGGDGLGCEGLSLIDAGDADAAKRDADRALPALRRACARSDAASCEAYGFLLLASGADADAAKAVRPLKQACDAGAPGACTQLGWAHINGRGGVGKADAGQAAGLYQSACRDGAGDPSACARLGLLYRSGRGVTKNDDRSKQLFKSACDAGNALGCFLGGGQSMNDEARNGLKQSCQEGETESCVELVIQLYRAHVAAGGHAQKEEEDLAKTACQRGDMTACGWLGLLLHEDPVKAARYDAAACDAQVDFACLNLITLFVNGSDAARTELAAYVSARRAAELYEQYCRNKSNDLCKSVKDPTTVTGGR